jgi:hypothetical protein
MTTWENEWLAITLSDPEQAKKDLNAKGTDGWVAGGMVPHPTIGGAALVLLTRPLKH